MKNKNAPLFYKPKSLIPGYKVEDGLEGLFAAVPDRGYKGNKFTILYYYPLGDGINKEYKCIERKVEDWNKADRYRRFMDKWGRGVYTLAYFKMADKF